MTNILKVVSGLNKELQAYRSDGGEVTVRVDTRPKIAVHSLEPLVYEKFGLLRNKGPIIAGRIAVEAFLSAQSMDDESRGNVVLVGRADQGLYGFQTSPHVFNSTATLLGRPELAVLRYS